jgi:hypothetical protein
MAEPEHIVDHVLWPADIAPWMAPAFSEEVSSGFSATLDDYLIAPSPLAPRLKTATPLRPSKVVPISRGNWGREIGTLLS